MYNPNPIGISTSLIFFLLSVNLYGLRDDFDSQTSHVIPAIIKKVHEAQVAKQNSISAWVDSSVSWEFLSAVDAAEGIVLATENFNKSEPVNLGSGMEVSIKDLTKMICKLMNFKGKIEWDTSKPNGQPRRCLDTSKAQQEFGFTSLEVGIMQTIEWYRKQQGDISTDDN